LQCNDLKPEEVTWRPEDVPKNPLGSSGHTSLGDLDACSSAK